MRTWHAHKAKLRALAYSPDGRWLATTAGRSKFVWLWDAATGELVRQLSGNTNPAVQVAFSPDGRFVAGTERWGRVRLWRLPSGDLARTFESGRHWVGDPLAFAPSGAEVVAPLALSASLLAWRVTGAEHDKPTRQVDHTQGYPDQLAFSPDGSRLVIASDTTVGLIDPATGLQQTKFVDPRGKGVTGALAFSPDGARLAVGFDARVVVWTLSAPRAVPRTLVGHAGVVRSVAFTPDGSTLLTAGRDGTVRLWDSETGAEKRAFDWGVGEVVVAAFAPDGLTAVAGSADGRLVVWDVDA